ncbi:MAG: hypothetical protein ACXABJ_07405, partial [Candidatus Heimdallarchaeaceae archaeon]
MSRLDPDKPNLVFRLSPVNAHYKDELLKLCEARLSITGALLQHHAEASMRDYYKYDYIALGGRPVRKRKKRLNDNKNRKHCTIRLEIKNYDMSPNVRWQLIFALSGRQGCRNRRSNRRYPIVQLFKTREELVSKTTDTETGEETEKTIKKWEKPLTKKVMPGEKYIMKEYSKKKKHKKLRHFWTKVEDPPGEPIHLYIGDQYFAEEPKPNNPKNERETYTYTLRLAGKRKDFDQILFFHYVNMFIVKDDQLTTIERREAERLEDRIDVQEEERVEDRIRQI